MSNAQNEFVLEMKGVVKEFPGVHALDGVNHKVRPGKVHVICGENGAGKSTLMKIINGTYVADEGEMIYKGEHVGARSVKDSLDMGIAMIYQELNPVLEMTLAENIWLGREPRNGPFVDFGKMYKDTQDLLDRLEMPYKASQKMYELSIAGHQLIEIAKAISCNASVIIMDEPSSAIGNEEIEVLFKQIFSLREQGVAILYITHKMDEIFRIADEITIIRDGKWIESGPASDYNPQKLVARMVGREITNVFPKDTTVPIGDVILEVKDLTQVKEDGGPSATSVSSSTRARSLDSRAWSAQDGAKSCAPSSALTPSPPARSSWMARRSTTRARATPSKTGSPWSTRTAAPTAWSLAAISTRTWPLST